MAIVYEKSKGLTDVELHYCPGCTHGIVHKLVAEVLEELGYRVESYELLGAILDTYNLIRRITCSIFFHCKVDTAKQEKTDRTEAEQILFKEVLWMDPQEALDRLENDVRCDVGKLVQRRDALALRYYLEHKDERERE